MLDSSDCNQAYIHARWRDDGVLQHSQNFNSSKADLSNKEVDPVKSADLSWTLMHDTWYVSIVTVKVRLFFWLVVRHLHQSECSSTHWHFLMLDFHLWKMFVSYIKHIKKTGFAQENLLSSGRAFSRWSSSIWRHQPSIRSVSACSSLRNQRPSLWHTDLCTTCQSHFSTLWPRSADKSQHWERLP